MIKIDPEQVAVLLMQNIQSMGLIAPTYSVYEALKLCQRPFRPELNLEVVNWLSRLFDKLFQGLVPQNKKDGWKDVYKKVLNLLPASQSIAIITDIDENLKRARQKLDDYKPHSALSGMGKGWSIGIMKERVKFIESIVLVIEDAGSLTNMTYLEYCQKRDQVNVLDVEQH